MTTTFSGHESARPVLHLGDDSQSSDPIVRLDGYDATVLPRFGIRAYACEEPGDLWVNRKVDVVSRHTVMLEDGEQRMHVSLLQ